MMGRAAALLSLTLFASSASAGGPIGAPCAAPEDFREKVLAIDPDIRTELLEELILANLDFCEVPLSSRLFGTLPPAAADRELLTRVFADEPAPVPLPASFFLLAATLGAIYAAKLFSSHRPAARQRKS